VEHLRVGEMISAGYHHAAGQPHAEVEALSQLDFRAQDTTLYVDLEPCSHHGRTSPCTDVIIQSGVRAVVAGMMDPNPLVQGRGFERLREAGIQVRVGLLEKECQELNRGFSRSITSGFPYVTLKLAATGDGKTATRSGKSKWITSEAARKVVHQLRRESDGVMVGVGTILKDNPLLTVRLSERQTVQPWRIILDSELRSPLESNVFDREAQALVFTSERAPAKNRRLLESRGVYVEVLKGEGRLDLAEVMGRIYARGLVYILAEPGAELAASLAAADLVDRYLFFYAPKLFGGADAPGMLGGRGVEEITQARALSWGRIQRIGPDLMVEAYPADRVPPHLDIPLTNSPPEQIIGEDD